MTVDYAEAQAQSSEHFHRTRAKRYAEDTVKDRRTSTGHKKDESRIKYGEFDPSPDKVTPNRLPNVRFPLGEEPWADVVGTDPDDGWVNLKLDVVENEKKVNQRDLLGGGQELKLACHRCKAPMFTAAEKDAKELLEEGGFHFKEGVETPDEKVVACVCHACGVVTQMRQSFVQRLLV